MVLGVIAGVLVCACGVVCGRIYLRYFKEPQVVKNHFLDEFDADLSDSEDSSDDDEAGLALAA